MLVAYNPSLLIQVIWQDATGASNASFMLDTIMDSKGGCTQRRSQGLSGRRFENVDYVSITTSANGFTALWRAGAWLCGGRAFAWKAYTTQPTWRPTCSTKRYKSSDAVPERQHPSS